MGLGWTTLEFPGETVRMHTGADWGEKAMAFYVVERDEGVVIVTNGANGFQPIIEVGQLIFPGTKMHGYLETGRSR